MNSRRVALIPSLVIAASLLSTACGKKNDVTKEGTVLVEWDVSKATRAAFRTAKIGPRASHDYKVSFANGEAPLALTVHVESAPVEYQEGTSTVKDIAPVAIRVTVASNADWTVSGKCQDGPNYNMPGYADGGFTYVPGIIEDCDIHYDRISGVLAQSSYQLLTSLKVESAKPITLFPAEDGRVE